MSQFGEVREGARVRIERPHGEEAAGTMLDVNGRVVWKAGRPRGLCCGPPSLGGRGGRRADADPSTSRRLTKAPTTPLEPRAAGRPGAILILHEGDASRASVVIVLEKVLSGLRNRGYEVVSVSELRARAEQRERHDDHRTSAECEPSVGACCTPRTRWRSRDGGGLVLAPDIGPGTPGKDRDAVIKGTGGIVVLLGSYFAARYP